MDEIKKMIEKYISYSEKLDDDSLSIWLQNQLMKDISELEYALLKISEMSHLIKDEYKQEFDELLKDFL